jgi:NAD(P)-dependent dehydrogenase (short-subunit alcohol dehydrogenase family)
MPITNPSNGGVSTAPLTASRVLVTGGTSGLGLAMARALAQAGARVVVTSRRGEKAQATAAQLGAEALGVQLDVRDVGSVSAAIDSVYLMLGGLDVLVNNAGIGMRTVNPRFMTKPQPFWKVLPDGFRDVLETKATGTFLVAREVVPRMLSTGGGRVVTISMSEQTMTRPGFVPYGPSGAAVEALARVMAADLAGTPVTANILLPGGATATGMIPDEMSDELRASLLDPAIMGPPIVWLASADAAGVHDERIVARDFDDWLGTRKSQSPTRAD